MIRFGDAKIKKIYVNGKKIKKVYHGDSKVYSAGNIVTYLVDTGVSYQEEVESDASCLSPQTFTPAKTGWTFVGWRADNTASGTVLTSKVMGDDPVTLYAVFRAAVTVTYYNGSATASTTSGYRYYNNGNTVNPSFTLTQAAKSGYTARGWSTSTAGNGSITVNNGVAFTQSTSITLYGMYQQTITLSYNGNGATSGSTAAQTGTRYYNSNGNAVNPSFALRANGFAKTSNTFYRWAFGSASGTQYAVGASVTLSVSSVFYAYWIVTVYNYDYTGSIRSFTVPATGTYKLEVYGAAGGTCSGAGGKGGYASGTASLTKGGVLYVVVGGAGADAPLKPSATTNVSGGYNGGGAGISQVAVSGYRWYDNAAGGGATHIGNINALLAATPAANLLIAAGGGGGGGYDYDYGTTGSYAGGAGGGTSGSKGEHSVYGGAGGTQSSGYAHGTGGSRGGGGGYYGGYGTSYYGGGGGGSAYIGGVVGGATSSGQRSGNGYATITLVSLS